MDATLCSCQISKMQCSVGTKESGIVLYREWELKCENFTRGRYTAKCRHQNKERHHCGNRSFLPPPQTLRRYKDKLALTFASQLVDMVHKIIQKTPSPQWPIGMTKVVGDLTRLCLKSEFQFVSKYVNVYIDHAYPCKHIYLFKGRELQQTPQMFTSTPYSTRVSMCIQ